MTQPATGRFLTATTEGPAPDEHDVFVFPMSFAQERLWFLDQLVPNNPFYNMPAALRLHGALDVSALAHALTALVERHEALRTTFATVDGQPRQVIQPPHPLALPCVDL